MQWLFRLITVRFQFQIVGLEILYKMTKKNFEVSPMMTFLDGSKVKNSIFFTFWLTILDRVGVHPRLWSQIVELLKPINMRHQPTRSGEK